MTDEPLLSVCIPTFNRAPLLRVMLEALLPQADKMQSHVEVIVCDNASTDDTAGVVAEAQGLGAIRYSRNDINIGPLGNIIKPAIDLARGKHVWILSDHNLLRPGALARVIDRLLAHPELSVFYVNFACAIYPEHWPAAALSGYAGPYSYLGNQDTADRYTSEWKDLVHGGHSALSTQIYAHIVRRDVWRNYWSGRRIDAAFASVSTTYPHTVMIVETQFASPAFYIGDPVLTIFNGAQSWGVPAIKARVSFQALPGLIDLFERKGLPASQMVEARAFAAYMAYETSVNLFNRTSPLRLFEIAALLGPIGAVRHRYLLPGIWQAFLEAEGTWFSRTARRALDTYRDRTTYLLRSSRPARWARARFARKARQ